MEQSSPTLESVVRACRGAFPTVVTERLRTLQLHDALPRELQTDEARASVFTPELHPLDYEWYFSRETAAALADAVTTRRPPLLLGAPTVADVLSGRSRSAVLVDRNQLAFARLGHRRGITFRRHDLRRPLYTMERAETVLFDAPWYVEHLLLWLWQASRLVRRRGRILFVLFPELVRPLARHERDVVLDVASLIGRVEVMRNAVGYETPLFEREALIGSGLTPDLYWRSADLISITRPTRLRKKPRVPPMTEEKWETFVVGTQVVKLRRFTTGGFEAIAPITGLKDFRLPTVSRRDDQRHEIDIWTSRNRVARVGDRKRVVRVLRQLEWRSRHDPVLRAHGVSVDRSSADVLSELLDTEPVR